jgi:hypothetical protein
MVILLNKRLDCETICSKINKLINSELSNVKDLENYALCITITKVVEECKINKLPLNNNL